MGFPKTENRGGLGFRSRAAFTLVEVLVGLAVFLMMLVVLVSLTSHTIGVWHGTEDQKIRQQSARLVFERMNREMEAAVFPLDGDTNRFSFLVNPGFAGLENPQSAFWQTMSSGDGSRGDITEVGYFVRWRDLDGRPVAELCRIEVPPEAADSILNGASQRMSAEKVERYAPTAQSSTNPMKGVLALNVVGLWVQLYEGTNAIPAPYDLSAATVTPTSAEISLALIDSRTAARLTESSEITSHYQSTPAQFLQSLPEDLRRGTRILTIRSRLAAARK